MAKILFLSVLAAIFWPSAPSIAGDAPAPTYVGGVDIQPLADELQATYMNVVKDPFLLYHWAPSKNLSEKNVPEFPANGSLAKQYFLTKSQLYFKNMGEKVRGNWYGPALYAAVDPVFTRGYGKEDWILMQMRVPAGFRVLKSAQQTLPQTSRQILDKLGCPAGSFLDDILRRMDANTKCAEAMKEVLQNKLKVDGMLYGYGFAHFDACPNSQQDTRRVAFVIVNSHSIPPDAIEVFNKNSKEERGADAEMEKKAKNDRVNIESLFYKNIADARLVSFDLYKFKENLDRAKKTLAKPGSEIVSIDFLKSDEQEKMDIFQVCRTTAANAAPADYAKRCGLEKAQSLETPVYPKLISRANPPVAGEDRSKPNELHWADLDNVPTNPDIDSWIKQNLYGCSEEPKIVPQSSRREKPPTAPSLGAEDGKPPVMPPRSGQSAQ